MSRLPSGLIVFALPMIAWSQPISFGVKAGVPISPDSQDYPLVSQVACMPGYASGLVCGRNDFEGKPYALGPTVEVFLPWNLSVEADVLYRRFHKDIAEGLEAPHGGLVTFGTRAGTAANAWFFPLLLKYAPLKRKLSPFVTAGATLRHLGPFDGQGFVLDFHLTPQAQSFHFESGRALDAAITAGVGLRVRVKPFDLSPEIRFLHWTSSYFQPAQNQAMLMLGVTFPAQKR